MYTTNIKQLNIIEEYTINYFKSKWELNIINAILQILNILNVILNDIFLSNADHNSEPFHKIL
jgi:hypothetical protein